MWGVYVFFISPLAPWFWSHRSAASPPGLSISVSALEPPHLFLLASSHETGVTEGGLRTERERVRRRKDRKEIGRRGEGDMPWINGDC